MIRLISTAYATHMVGAAGDRAVAVLAPRAAAVAALLGGTHGRQYEGQQQPPLGAVELGELADDLRAIGDALGALGSGDASEVRHAGGGEDGGGTDGPAMLAWVDFALLPLLGASEAVRTGRARGARACEALAGALEALCTPAGGALRTPAQCAQLLRALVPLASAPCVTSSGEKACTGMRGSASSAARRKPT